MAKMLPTIVTKQTPKPSNPHGVFQSSFESFLTAKDVSLDIKPKISPAPENNNLESIDEEPVPIKKKRGRKPQLDEPENLEDLQNGSHAVEVAHNKWAQNCENCPSLVHLMYNYLIEISEGRHHPIQYGTPANEIIEHLSEALGYNERQIQRMIRMGEKPYRCRYCTEAYSTKVELQGHMTTLHADIKTIPCLECEKMFHSKDNLRAHMLTAHKPKPHKDYPCPVEGCDKEYVSFKMLKRHCDKIHPGCNLSPYETQQSPVQDQVSPEISVHDIEPFNISPQIMHDTPSTRGRGRGRGRGASSGVSRGRGGKRGRPAKQKVMESDEDSEDLPIDREDDEFLLNTESEISSDEDEMDFVEERF